MEITASCNYSADELALLRLRELFEKRGFRHINVNKFEEYSLYTDNSSFLESENIISFMDINGKLMALKPDITLSIVKNIPKSEPTGFSRMYYVDEVYRLSRENQEYKVLNQIGVELIGPADNFSGIEIISLALESLSRINGANGDYLLDISHLGFLSGIFDAFKIYGSLRKRAMAEIRSKSLHNLAGVLFESDLSPENIELIETLCGMGGSFSEVLPRLKPLQKKLGSVEIDNAYSELEHIGKVAELLGFSNKIRLDFSVVGDLDYYNGIVFAGYISGIPKEILTGGRYDNLMKKMKKQSCALGFGICLSALGQYLKADKTECFDYDFLIKYESFDDAEYQAKLLRAVDLINQKGLSARLEPSRAIIDFTYENSAELSAANIDEFLNELTEEYNNA